MEAMEATEGHSGTHAASNVTLLPGHMIGEILERSHDHDLLAVICTCPTAHSGA